MALNDVRVSILKPQYLTLQSCCVHSLMRSVILEDFNKIAKVK